MNDLFKRERLPSAYIDVDPALPFEWSENKAVGGINIHLDGGDLIYSEQFFSDKISDRTVAYLQENQWRNWRDVKWPSISEQQLRQIDFLNIKWKQDYIKFFGKTVPLPRLTAWYGDPGASYKYSGIRSDPNSWNKGLDYLRCRIEEATGSNFNSVLLNWYRDGSDSLNWHADDEKELGPQPTIASASFGASREFLFKRKGDKKTSLKVTLRNGSLLVMKGLTQQNWVHSVPKRKGILGSRFNLTFRHIQADLA